MEYPYNLHAHSLLSDGELLPSEIAVRYMSLGYKIIAITDHADYSNIDYVIKSILKFTKHWPKSYPLKVLPGIELTQVPLEHFRPLAKYARGKGIKIIVAHGQTIAEPLIKGTNRAALEADIDILAHPGYITDADTNLAKEKGIFLEVTSRKGHCQTNSHVVKQAKKHGAKIILNHDSHSPEDIIKPPELTKIGLKSGLKPQDIEKICSDIKKFLSEI